jgi:hypothetical protein
MELLNKIDWIIFIYFFVAGATLFSILQYFWSKYIRRSYRTAEKERERYAELSLQLQEINARLKTLDSAIGFQGGKIGMKVHIIDKFPTVEKEAKK